MMKETEIPLTTLLLNTSYHEIIPSKFTSNQKANVRQQETREVWLHKCPHTEVKKINLRYTGQAEKAAMAFQARKLPAVCSPCIQKNVLSVSSLLINRRSLK